MAHGCHGGPAKARRRPFRPPSQDAHRGRRLAGPQRPPGGTAFGFRQRVEHCRQHAQTQCQDLGVGRAATHRKLVIEAVDGDFPGDEGPRDRLGPPQEGKYEKADGEGSTGGALGKERQAEQRRRNARQPSPVRSFTAHLRASVSMRMVGRAFRHGDKIAARSHPESRKPLIPLEGAVLRRGQ
jgi:hypothetical protein